MQFMCKVPHHLLRSRQFLVPSYLRYRTTNELAKNSSQTTIASFIENDGIIRVGGCLTVSQWPYGTMHSVMKAYTLDSQDYYLRPDYDFGRWGAMPSQQRSITCICAKSRLLNRSTNRIIVEQCAQISPWQLAGVTFMAYSSHYNSPE